MVRLYTDAAVAVFTIVQRPQVEPHVLLVSQFRPPVGGMVVELPAGLVDAGEESDEGTQRAALRELQEETGFGAASDEHSVNVKLVSRVMYSDPGLSGANMKLCTVEIDLAKDAPEPVAHPDEGEFIERHLVPLRSLQNALDGTCYCLPSLPAARLRSRRTSRTLGRRPPARPLVCPQVTLFVQIPIHYGRICHSLPLASPGSRPEACLAGPSLNGPAAASPPGHVAN